MYFPFVHNDSHYDSLEFQKLVSEFVTFSSLIDDNDFASTFFMKFLRFIILFCVVKQVLFKQLVCRTCPKALYLLNSCIV